MSTVTKQPMYGWNTLRWPKIQRDVFKLQKRIYQASRRGDVKRVRKLQRLLLRSWSARLLAVRRVTQDNRGKKTAGVDGVKSLSPPQRLTLAENLKLEGRAKPVRRSWIPKPGSDEKRPLGIPIMADRARQALVKAALEPEWEARFEANSYGFRPGRSAHDAIKAIYGAISQKAKWVLDADIAKCFDRINHEALLAKINTSPTLRRQIKAWLKAGVMSDGKLFPTEAGTPQGGTISPLLANIALHGLELMIIRHFPRHHVGFNRPLVVRFADDLAPLHAEREVIELCWKLVSEWLAEMGLELNPRKTRIAHTLETVEGVAGFDFLGFQIRPLPGRENEVCSQWPGTAAGIDHPDRTERQSHRATPREAERNDSTPSRSESSELDSPLESADSRLESLLRARDHAARLFANERDVVCDAAGVGQAPPPGERGGLGSASLLGLEERVGMEIPNPRRKSSVTPTRGDALSKLREGGGDAQPLRRRLAVLEREIGKASECQTASSQTAQATTRTLCGVRILVCGWRFDGSGSPDSDQARRNQRRPQPATTPPALPRCQNGQGN